MPRSDVTYDIYYEDGVCPECKRSSRDGTEHKPWCPSIVRARQDAHEAKVTGIVADGIARLEAQAKANTSGPPANVGERHRDTGLPCAPVRFSGTDGEAQAAVTGYNRALADSLKGAHEAFQKLAQQYGLLSVEILRVAEERLAEDHGRLRWLVSGDDLLREVGRVGVESSVAVGRKK